MVPVLISRDFLEYFQKFRKYTFDDFQNSKEIDWESFTFIHQLLFTNKSEWYLNLSFDDIFKFIESSSDISNEEETIAALIKNYKSNVLKSGSIEYTQVYRQEYSEINREKLQPYIFLGDVEKSICEEIENELGVVIVSIKFETKY